MKTDKKSLIHNENIIYLDRFRSTENITSCQENSDNNQTSDDAMDYFGKILAEGIKELMSKEEDTGE